MKEVYKFKNYLFPPIVSNLFQIRKNVYKLQNSQQLDNSKKNTVKMGLETNSYSRPKVWNFVLREIRNSHIFSIFKKKNEK